jgi:hypothetical protein
MKNTRPIFRRAAIRPAIALMVIANFLTPSAAKEYRVCVGEYERGCPVEHDIYLYCYASAQVIAARVCTKTVNGNSQSAPFKLIMLGSRGGNKCGYSWFKLVCEDD